MEMEIEKQARTCTLNLTKRTQWHQVKKFKLHARGSLKTVRNLPVDVPLRNFATNKRFDE